jgi:GTP-binding protein HflX
MREIELAEIRVEKASKQLDVVKQAEKALLVSTDSDRSLDELNSPASTAGALVVSRALQNRLKPDPATYIGKGKAEALQLDCQALESIW